MNCLCENIYIDSKSYEEHKRMNIDYYNSLFDSSIYDLEKDLEIVYSTQKAKKINAKIELRNEYKNFLYSFDNNCNYGEIDVCKFMINDETTGKTMFLEELKDYHCIEDKYLVSFYHSNRELMYYGNLSLIYYNLEDIENYAIVGKNTLIYDINSYFVIYDANKLLETYYDFSIKKCLLNEKLYYIRSISSERI